jgi:hypothetical protein
MGRSVANPRGPIVSALRRAADLAQRAGKRRTSAWLRVCADIVEREGLQAEWPEAPAYKGAVVHVENPENDLRELTADQLAALFKAAEDEQFRREVG